MEMLAKSAGPRHLYESQAIELKTGLNQQPIHSLVSMRLICTLYTSGAVYGYTHQATKAIIMESKSRNNISYLSCR